MSIDGQGKENDLKGKAEVKFLCLSYYTFIVDMVAYIWNLYLI